MNHKENQMIALGERLLELRKSIGATQEFVADKLGVSAQAVSKWENGDSSPDIALLKAISSFYRISLDTLLNVTYQPEIETVESRVEEMILAASRSDETQPMRNDKGELIWRVWKSAFFSEEPNEDARIKEKKRGKYRVVSKDNLMIWDDAGYAAIVKDDIYEKFNDISSNEVAILTSLLEESYLRVITLFKPQIYLSRDEVAEMTGLDDSQVADILLDLLTKGLLKVHMRKYYLSPAKGIAVATFLTSLYLLRTKGFSLSEYHVPNL